MSVELMYGGEREEAIRDYPRGRTQDYCGYCGYPFKRSSVDTEEVCRACLNESDPELRDSILEDIEYAEADRANDRDLEERARRGK